MAKIEVVFEEVFIHFFKPDIIPNHTSCYFNQGALLVGNTIVFNFTDKSFFNLVPGM